MKIYKLSQIVKECDEDQESNAEKYFSIGHGDYNEDVGFEPSFIIWVFDGNSVLYEEVTGFDESSGRWEDDKTHGTIWGHDFTDKLYKGRYEPETGTLSIVKPHRNRFRDVPEIVFNALKETFDNIKAIYIF